MSDINMNVIRSWIDEGSKPDSIIAPSIHQIWQLESDRLIIRVDNFGAERPRWLITATGNYEADRCRFTGAIKLEEQA